MGVRIGMARADDLAKIALPGLLTLLQPHSFAQMVMLNAALETPLSDREYRPLRGACGLHLMRCECRAGASERPSDEQHQAFSVTLIERGTLTYRTRSGSAVLSPGWLMLGNQGEGYVCSHEQSDGTGDDCVVLSMSARALDEALTALGVAGSRLRFDRASLPPSPRVAALLGILLADGDEGFALEETALAVISNVQRSLNDGAAPAPMPRQDERALAAAHFIESRAEAPLTLDDVAASVGVSVFHLMRIFRRAIGVTPHQYLMRIRLLRAVQMLRDTEQPVTTIAYDAGWSDLSNFTRTFRREVGCSPGQYRLGKSSVAGTA
jgi:AraC family transcriptional regulator